MDRTGAACYVYAKASGMLAKSFVGSKAVKLFNVKSLQELWSLLFTDEVPAVPQTILAQEIEKKAAQKFINEYIMLVSSYSKPAPVLLDLLQWFDYENIKNAGAKLAANNSGEIEFQSIKPYNILNYDKWPDIAKMTSGTELSWYNKVPLTEEVNLLANSVDTQFIKKIWSSIQKLPKPEREVARNIIAKHYSLMNITWAMRLKVFYNMDADKISEHLIYLDEKKSSGDLFAGDALKILDYKIDLFDDWAKFKYVKLLNNNDDGKFWKLDPLYFEEQVSKEFASSMKREFHKNPFTSMVLITWFFIKREELTNIRTATEAIRLNIDTDLFIKSIV